ncbi:MAG: hypothetical protein II821_06160 [Treponema sp.]|nr:hypothetical protein [Treponema sp.]
MKSNSAKKIFLTIQILILFFSSLCLLSCADLVSGEVYEKTDAVRYVYITLESSKSSVAVSQAARSICTPGIDFESRTQDYYFYIWGKSTSGNVDPKEVTFAPESGNTGTIELDFPVMSYTFTLAATETEIEPSDSSTPISTTDILSKAIAIGYTQADLTYSKNVKFTLSENGLTAPGNAFLNFYLDEDTWTDEQVQRVQDNFLVTVGFYNLDGTARTADWGLDHLNTETPVSTNNWFRSVLPGTYKMVVTFAENGGEYLTCTYSDIIIISPNRTITADVVIPNVLLDLPVVPSDFKAAWCLDYRFYSIYDSATDTATSLTSNDQIEEYNLNTYGILLSWQDNSNNETGFKVTLADLSKISDGTRVPSQIIEDVNSTAMTDELWKEIVEPFEGNTDVVKVFEPSSYSQHPDYFSGSVEKNETSLIVLGIFGSCYVAKIEAVNPAGLSDACYVTVDESFNYDATYTGKAFASATNPCRVINLYRIKYYLCGGKITYTHGPNSIASNETYIVKYRTYGDGEIDCYTAANTAEGTSDNPALILFASDPADNKRWQKWTYGSIGGTDLIYATKGSSLITGGTEETTADPDNFTYQKPGDYTGYTSLYLFASYE